MVYYGNELYHHGILGQKWGLRRFQNLDGSYKSGAEGRYGNWKAGSGTSLAKNVVTKATGSTKSSSTTSKTNSSKSTSQLAKEVIQGKWGNGEERKKKLKAAGYDYSTVQAEVNKMLKSNSSSSTSTKSSNSSKSSSSSKTDEEKKAELSKKRANREKIYNEVKALKKKIADTNDPDEKKRLQEQLTEKQEELDKATKSYNNAVKSYNKSSEGSSKSLSEKTLKAMENELPDSFDPNKADPPSVFAGEFLGVDWDTLSDKEKSAISETYYNKLNEMKKNPNSNSKSSSKVNTIKNSVKEPSDFSVERDGVDSLNREHHKEWIANAGKEKGWSKQDVAKINAAYDKMYDINEERVKKYNELQNETDPVRAQKLANECAALEQQEKAAWHNAFDIHSDVAEKAAAKHCYYVAGGNELYHHGILGQKWGVRRYQNKDGTLTEEGRKKYLNPDGSLNKKGTKFQAKMEVKDTKWANKNYEKITSKAYKQSRKELKPYQKELSKNPYSKRTQNEYNRHMAEIMNTKVSDLRSPSGKTIKFVAKRGQLGVHMGLATDGYDMSQVKNGVWTDGRIAYKKNSVGTI